MGFSGEEEDANCITQSVKMAQPLTPGITLVLTKVVLTYLPGVFEIWIK